MGFERPAEMHSTGISTIGIVTIPDGPDHPSAHAQPDGGNAPESASPGPIADTGTSKNDKKVSQTK